MKTIYHFRTATNLLLRPFALLALLAAQFSVFTTEAKAQAETDAFYIYRNDGHFDGFFYEDVQKITYSFLDTLGVEHDDYVSQEIVTADSTYRIMLSAIDSVGFVQPQVKYNPRLRLVSEDQLFTTLISHDEEYENLVFAGSTPEALRPRVGDVFASFDIENGWSGKVTEVGSAGGNITVKCAPIDEITDIFHQFVMVEQYDVNRSGQLIRRRVAGRPDLTVNNAPRRAEGTWQGDLFNFSLSGHVPLYASDNLNITIDPTIEGKLHLKTAWNLSLFGDKYIGIESQLDFGVGLGFTVDGLIKEFFPGGIGGLLDGVPVPATFPLIYLDITPDAFIRGDAHIKFSAQAPKLKGGMWSKLEINNWWPSMSVGLGNPNGDAYWDATEKGSAGLSVELNGFIQAGMLFPMKFKSLPVLKKLFAADIGGTWFIGPKVAGAIALDLTNPPGTDTGAYTLMKNTKLSLHIVDADFEVKGTVKTAFSDKQEVTLADGSISLFPPLDAAFVPEFGDCEVSAEKLFFHKADQKAWSAAPDNLEGTQQACRVFAFGPSGAVLSPVTMGTALFKKNEEGKYELVESQTWPRSYYHIHQLMGQEVPKNIYPQFILWDNKELSPYPDGAYKVYPVVEMFGKEWLGEPAYDFNIGEAIPASITHHPAFFPMEFKMDSYNPEEKEYLSHHTPAATDGIYIDGWTEDVENAMKDAKVLPNDAGTINYAKDGLSMTGTYNKDTNKGEGTFTLSTSYSKEVMNVADVEYYFSTFDCVTEYLYKNNGVFSLMMSGDIKHDIKGTFTVEKRSSGYAYTFKGEGPFELNGTALSAVINPPCLQDYFYFEFPPMEVQTTTVTKTGNTKMEYELKVKE